jgi:hypothetical protein
VPHDRMPLDQHPLIVSASARFRAGIALIVYRQTLERVLVRLRQTDRRTLFADHLLAAARVRRPDRN